MVRALFRVLQIAEQISEFLIVSPSVTVLSVMGLKCCVWRGGTLVMSGLSVKIRRIREPTVQYVLEGAISSGANRASSDHAVAIDHRGSHSAASARNLPLPGATSK